MNQYITDPSLRELAADIQKMISDGESSLASGIADSFDSYRFHVGHISALQYVLGRCYDLDRRRYGPIPADE